MTESGRILREARRAGGLSQRRLALRAGTSQARVSRIETGLEAPSLERLAGLLRVLGRKPVLDARRVAAPLSRDVARTPEERLREAAGWNLVATRLELAGERARRDGHPATRRG